MQHASFKRLAGFEEDIDVTSGSTEGVTIRGDSLATWSEETLALRSRNRANTSASQENQAVRLGWNNRIEGSDTTRMGPPARYRVELPARLASEWAVRSGHSISLGLTATPGMPGPRKNPDAGPDRNEEEGEQARRSRGSGAGDDDEPPPVDLSVEIEDAGGRRAKVTLSDYGPIRRPLDITIWRRGDQEDEAFADRSEVVLQGYEILLADFLAQEPALDLSRLRAISLVFDRVPAGEVLVDDIGLSNLGDSWWESRLR
jgi:hypothetical protein